MSDILILQPGDDAVHSLTACSVVKGTRLVETRCGTKLSQDSDIPLYGATGWQSRVTCPNCKERP